LRLQRPHHRNLPSRLLSPASCNPTRSHRCSVLPPSNSHQTLVDIGRLSPAGSASVPSSRRQRNPFVVRPHFAPDIICTPNTRPSIVTLRPRNARSSARHHHRRRLPRSLHPPIAALPTPNPVRDPVARSTGAAPLGYHALSRIPSSRLPVPTPSWTIYGVAVPSK
jgi:hypothetical protein